MEIYGEQVRKNFLNVFCTKTLKTNELEQQPHRRTMSFGDFSKSGRAPQRTNLTPTQPTITEEDESNSGAFAQISDGILQYQVRR